MGNLGIKFQMSVKKLFVCEFILGEVLPETALTQRQQASTMCLASEFKVIRQLNEFLQLYEMAQIN